MYCIMYHFMEMKSSKFYGHAIHLIRHNKGWTQAYMASVLNIKRSRLSGIENGKYNISINEACLILGKLGYSMELNI